MSYNIDTFKVKKLENLKIDVKNISGRYVEHKTDFETGITEFFENESLYIAGKVEDRILSVSSVECYGEGSGSFMQEVLEDAFDGSTGTLIASCVWEGGDSINQLRVENGKVEWVDIEI